MARSAVVLSLLVLCATSGFCQTTASTPSVSDPQAIAIATKSLLAMTGGAAVNDATLTGTVRWIAGSDDETGTATFRAKGAGESRVDIDLNNGARSEVRRNSQGVPTGEWKKGHGKVTSAAQHNCWTDAVWFFPALSSLTQVSNPKFVFSYIGQEQHNGLSVLHLRVMQLLYGDTPKLNISRYSAMDFYLDPISYLPSAISFNLHPDMDLGTDIPNEIRFADYRRVSGVQVPFHIQRLLNGSLLMDAVVSNADINASLGDTEFTLQ